jgi:MFS superfamily sulfate permease-like transporter
VFALPLQFTGIPGAPELIIIIGITGLFSVVPAFLVYRDATRWNNDSATLWGVATLLGGLIASLFGALLVVGRE